MTRLAEAASKIEDLEERVKFHAEEARIAKRALADLAPAMVELQSGLTGAVAIIHALEVYQGGTPGTPPCDLARTLRKELERLRDVAEANAIMPGRRVCTDFAADPEEDPTVEITDEEE